MARDPSQMSDEELLSGINDRYMRGATLRTPQARPDPRVDASAAASRASAASSMASAGSSAASAARTRQQMGIDASIAPYQKRAAEAEAQLKAFQARQASEAARARQEKANTILSMVKQQEGLYNKDIKGQPASRLWGATEYMDFLPQNERFRDAGKQILPLIRPLVAQSAKAGDSDKEMTIFESYIPSNDDTDINIENKFKALRVLVGGIQQGKTPSELEKMYDLKSLRSGSSRKTSASKSRVRIVGPAD